MRKLDLTPEIVSRACAALSAEVDKGACFVNPAAVLASRLEAGWIPPEVGRRGSDTDTEEWEYIPPPQVERASLPPLVDAWGHSWDAYEWFECMKTELKLQLLSETFEAWLHDAQLVDYRAADEERPGVLTVRLRNRYAYEWVTGRLHKVIQRLVDEMTEGSLTIEYTAPLEEPEPTTGEDAAQPAKHNPSSGVYTNVYTPCIHLYTREVRA